MENDVLRVEILPDLGARINRFEHRASGRDLLWHSPRVEPRVVPMGASYDDNFAGGWDELFPNDLPGQVGDTYYPDHGELWCQPWTHRIVRDDSGEVTLVLERRGSVTTTVVEKRLTLRAGEPQLRMSHRVTNIGRKPFEFLYKMHPALAIDAGDRIDVPGRQGELVDPVFGRVQAPVKFSWPVANSAQDSSTDLSIIPELDGTRDFVYVSHLDAGWCALRRMQLGLGFGLVFPSDVFSSVWLFMTFGGWRGLETVVLEPCTTIPKDLNAAIARGTARKLGPGETLEWETRAVLFDGVEPPRGFSEDGSVIRDSM